MKDSARTVSGNAVVSTCRQARVLRPSAIAQGGSGCARQRRVFWF